MIYNLTGCLQQANSFFLDDCVDDIVSSWTPLIQIFNGDLLSIRILEIRSASNHLEPDGIYESVIFPFTQAYLKDYYGKDIFPSFREVNILKSWQAGIYWLCSGLMDIWKELVLGHDMRGFVSSLLLVCSVCNMDIDSG